MFEYKAMVKILTRDCLKVKLKQEQYCSIEFLIPIYLPVFAFFLFFFFFCRKIDLLILTYIK